MRDLVGGFRATCFQHVEDFLHDFFRAFSTHRDDRAFHVMIGRDQR